MARQATECDWNEIERRVKSGDSYRSIAKDHPISHVSVMNRSKSEGWLNGKDGNKALEKIAAYQLTRPPSSVKTPEKFAEILNHIKSGMSPTTAAAASGIGTSTLSDWRGDPDIDAAVKEARLTSLGKAEQSIYDAHERGDWKAALARLQRASETREDWQDESQGGGGITVVVNVDRGAEVTAGDRVIDVTPE